MSPRRRLCAGLVIGTLAHLAYGQGGLEWQPGVLELLIDASVELEVIEGSAQLPDALLESLADIEGLSAEPIATLSVELLEDMECRAEAALDRDLYPLWKGFLLRWPTMRPTPEELAARLTRDARVSLAYPLPVITEPPLPPNFESQQYHLNPSSAQPIGLDFYAAWMRAGGDGSGVKVCDIEFDWRRSHLDVTQMVGAEINPNAAPVATWAEHGTAIAGHLVANDNGWGTTGGCYGAELLTCSARFNPGSVWMTDRALMLASAAMGAGDVILLELQYTLSPPSGGTFVPIEWWGTSSAAPQTRNSVYAAIETAVGLGIHVVEASGNGSVDLDTLTWFGDSGAIIVGGGYPLDLIAMGFSSYGSRVDVQGPGAGTVTTGYGQLHSAEGLDLYYTNTFGGTSAAAGVVAAAVVDCVGVWKAMGRSPAALTPATLRNVLVATGRPHPVGSRLIGPQPDLAAALAALDSLAGGCGDCDQDLTIADILDALTAAQIAVGRLIPTGPQISACDVNSSSSITILDSLAIAQVAAGFPVILDCP